MHRNGEVLVDEVEKIDDSMGDDIHQEIEDEIDANEMMLNNATENNDQSIVHCTTESGKSKYNTLNTTK